MEEFNYSNEVYNNLYKIIPDETKVYELSFSTDIGSCVYLSDSERNILFSTSSQNNSTGKIVYELKAGETYYIYFYIKYKKTDNKISSKIFDGVPELEIQQELSLSKQSYENIPLKWENIIENETVVEYEIYRDGKYIDKTINSYYTDKDVLPNKEYEYKIYGVNKYNNKVSVSNTLIASRKMENEPPSTPKITNINVGSTSAAFMWDYCKDNVGISKYEIYLDGKYVKSEEAIYNYSNVSKLLRKTSHTIKVRAVDICGNKSDFSEEVFITTKDDDYCSERGVYPEIKLGEEIKGMFNYSFDSDLFKFEAKDTILSTITLDVNDRYKDKIIIRIIAHGDNFKSYSYATEKVFDLQLLAGTTYYIGPDSEMFYTTNYTFSMKQSEVPNEVKNKQLINKDDHSVSIKWDPATDDVGIKCYNIYRDNMLIGSVDGNTTNYQDKGLYSSTKYKYEVEAEDDSGNKSSKCDYLCVTTDKDTIAPKAATNLKCISKTDHSITLGWDDAIDNEKVKNYDVYIDDQYVETVDSTSITVYNLEDRTEYSFKVIAKDEYDNTSEFSEEVTIKTILIDKPINLKCDSKGKKTIRLSWDQLKDNEIIEKYYIYINGEKRYETEGLTFAKFCFNPGTTYKFNVSEVDAEGNESPLSDEIVVTTDSEDMLSAPTNLKCDSKGKKTIRLSWDQLKDNEIIEKYYIYINGEKRYETNGLTFAKFCFNPGTTYKFNVSAVDAEGNESPLSDEIVVTTDSEDMLSAPTNLKCDSKGKKTIRLSWDQLKDNEIIEKYYIYINGEKRYETEGLTFAKFCFNPGTTYKFNVSAVDVR